MLQSQVNYWNLQETKRHNMVMEQLESQKTEYSGLTANANVMQAETSRMLVPIEQQKANATTMQAEAAKENVQVNWANAYTNARNAATNERNAATNERNADTNALNALTNRESMIIDRRNADTNYARMVSDRRVNDTLIALNQAETGLTSQKTDTEKYKTGLTSEQAYQSSIASKYATANNIMNLVGGGAEALKDVATIFKDTSQGGEGLVGAFLKIAPFIW